jgi:hypothetical protein
VKGLIEEQLTELKSAHTSLLDLESREQMGRGAISPQERQTLFRRITNVQVFCTSQLVSAVRPLTRDLAQPSDVATLEKLLQEAETPTTGDHAVEHRGQERIPAGTSMPQVARSEREIFYQEAEPSLAVAVSSTLLEGLKSHPQRLEGYIKGYMLCQELSGRCDATREAFERARTQGIRQDDWERVWKSLNEMSGKVNELGPRLRGDVAEFQELVETVETAVKEARLLVKNATELELLDPSAEPAMLVRHLKKMRYAVDEMAGLCPSRAEATLGELRDVISQIFGEIGRQREAQQGRRAVSDRAAGHTVKIPTQAPAGTVAEKGG